MIDCGPTRSHSRLGRHRIFQMINLFYISLVFQTSQMYQNVIYRVWVCVCVWMRLLKLTYRTRGNKMSQSVLLNGVDCGISAIWVGSVISPLRIGHCISDLVVVVALCVAFVLNISVVRPFIFQIRFVSFRFFFFRICSLEIYWLNDCAHTHQRNL